MRPTLDKPTVGAFVLEKSWRLWDRDDLENTCLTLASCGVNRFMTETWLPDQSLIDAVHDYGMEFWTSVACFSDHADPLRSSRSELTPITPAGTPREQQEWYVGLIPTDDVYNSLLVRRCERVAAGYSVDGFGLDFMRWPLHWELEFRPGQSPVDSSFDHTSLQKFCRFDPGMPDDLVGAEAAAHILAERLESWIAFKCHAISTLTARIKKAISAKRPQTGTGVFVVPGNDFERQRYAGQDVCALGVIVNELFPMTYHRIVGQDLHWITDTVRVIRSKAAARITPVIQISADAAFAGEADWGASMNPGDAHAALDTGFTVGGGVIVFPGEALLLGPQSDALQAILRRVTAEAIDG